MKSRWFEIWFNTAYCDMLYKHRDEEEARQFVVPMLDYLQLPLGASFLDAGCGKGRHAKIINEKGYEVTGIDLSYKNIRDAKQLENESLSFFIHDMRNVFRVNYFDAIVNIYTSFGYYENPKENDRVIRAFASGLKPNGKLVLDFFNLDYVIRHMVEDENKIIDGIEFRISKDYRGNKLLKEITVRDDGKEKTFYEVVTCLQLEDFEEYFRNNGLKVADVFGNYSFDPYDPKTSERLIIVAEK